MTHASLDLYHPVPLGPGFFFLYEELAPIAILCVSMTACSSGGQEQQDRVRAPKESIGQR